MDALFERVHGEKGMCINGEVVRHLLGVADYVALSTYFHYFLGLGLARERSESAFAVKKMTHVQTQNMHPTVVFFSENDTSIR